MKKQSKCKRCGHEWTSRVAKPQECPACKSRAWDKAKKSGKQANLRNQTLTKGRIRK